MTGAALSSASMPHSSRPDMNCAPVPSVFQALRAATRSRRSRISEANLLSTGRGAASSYLRCNLPDATNAIDPGIDLTRVLERLADPPREVLRRKSAVPAAQRFRFLERRHRGVFVVVVRFERVLRVLRRAEKRPDPAVLRKLLRERLESARRFLEIAGEVFFQRPAETLFRLTERGIGGGDGTRRRQHGRGRGREAGRGGGVREQRRVLRRGE